MLQMLNEMKLAFSAQDKILDNVTSNINISRRHLRQVLRTDIYGRLQIQLLYDTLQKE